MIEAISLATNDPPGAQAGRARDAAAYAQGGAIRRASRITDACDRPQRFRRAVVGATATTLCWRTGNVGRDVIADMSRSILYRSFRSLGRAAGPSVDDGASIEVIHGPAMMPGLSSCSTPTCTWRSTERAKLDKKPSTRSSQEPCSGSERPSGLRRRRACRSGKNAPNDCRGSVRPPYGSERRRRGALGINDRGCGGGP